MRRGGASDVCTPGWIYGLWLVGAWVRGWKYLGWCQCDTLTPWGCAIYPVHSLRHNSIGPGKLTLIWLHIKDPAQNVISRIYHGRQATCGFAPPLPPPLPPAPTHQQPFAHSLSFPPTHIAISIFKWARVQIHNTN